MTATAKMTGRMVGIIMGGGTGAGTVVTTGTVATVVIPGPSSANTGPVVPAPVLMVCRSEAAGSSILERSERPGSSGEAGTGAGAARSSSRVT